MKRIALLVGLLAWCIAPAIAADLPTAPTPYIPAPAAPPPPYDWSGIYVGGFGGYGWASEQATDTFSGGLLGGVTSSGGGTVQGAIAGADLGYNFQMGLVVLGIEGDWAWSDQQKSQSFTCGWLCAVTGKSQVNWLASARVRAGVALDKILVYGTGGAAWINAGGNTNLVVGNTTYSLLNANSTKTGFAIGAGVEGAVTENIIIRAEYLFMRFENLSNTETIGAPIGGTVTASGNANDSLIRVGIDLKFKP